MSRIELTVRRRGEAPRVSPAATIEAAAIGLSHAAADYDVRTAVISEARRITYQLNGEAREVTYHANLITFTRTGPQRFASGHRAWFDQKERPPVRGIKRRKEAA